MIAVAALVKEYAAPPAWRDLLRGRLRGAAVRALDGIALEVPAGGALALMGPNGAGKTTLLRVLAGLTTPSGGRAEVAGESRGAALRRRVGFVGVDERSFSLRLSARENLAFFAALHGFRRAEALARVDALLERVGLAAHARRPFHQLSSGMRQRAALARGLIAEPEVLLLDEPTRGIDPAGARALRALLAEAARGRTLLVATHDPADAAALCPRVALIARGRIRAEVAPADAQAALAAEAE